jgi:hypothetical protein
VDNECLGQRQKRSTFLSLGEKMYYSNKVLKKSNLGAAYKPQLSKIKFSINDGNKFQGSEIDQLICGDRGNKCTGETGRNFEKKTL